MNKWAKVLEFLLYLTITIVAILFAVTVYAFATGWAGEALLRALVEMGSL